MFLIALHYVAYAKLKLFSLWNSTNEVALQVDLIEACDFQEILFSFYVQYASNGQ